MISLLLPDASSQSLQLVHPNPAEKYTQTIKNSSAWRGPLSQAAYVRREEYLARQALTTKSGLTHWILVDIDEPVESRRILCGCETICKRAFVVRDGQVSETVSHCISNVFCPPEYRGQGYAKRMMKELGVVLKMYQVSKATIQNHFSTLWSDIGREFYARHGWKAFTSAQISLPVRSAAPPDLTLFDACPAEPLSASDLKSLCEADIEALRDRLRCQSTAVQTAICLIPDFETISWHHARENFISTELHGEAPAIKGALVSGDLGQRAWCYWTCTWNSSSEGVSGECSNTLYILRLALEDFDLAQASLQRVTNINTTRWDEDSTDCSRSSGDNESGSCCSSKDDACSSESDTLARLNERESRLNAVEKLLRAARKHAELWRMDSVVLWNATDDVLEAARRVDVGARMEHRNDSIPSLKWLGCDEPGKIEWLGNEKHEWC